MGANELSRYRSAVMGFAILWIMVYHSGLSFSWLPVLGNAANSFRSNGFGGVDIFLFVSGFGLYQSLSRAPGQLAFYKRRLLRVLPAYLPVLAVWLVLRLPGVPKSVWPQAILGNLTGTAFWRGPAPVFNWYMLALFSFYFIAPFFFLVIERPRGAGLILGATLVLDACFYGHSVMIAVVRFTVFALGMIAGRWFARGGKIDRPLELAMYALGLFSYWLLVIFCGSLSGGTLWNGGFYWYPFIFAAPALAFLLCRMFAWMEGRAPRLLRLFEITGACSQEIYLIHIVAFDYIHPRSAAVWPFIYAAMLLCGYIYHAAIAKFIARLSGLRRPAGGGEEGASLEQSAGSKKTYIEFLRIAAAFLVIVNHTNSGIFLRLQPSATWLCSLTYFFVCKIAVPLFLFIMGALLLGKEDTPEKTKARLLRVFTVFAAASLCYYVYYQHRNGAPVSIREFLLKLPKTNISVALWYLYLYLGLLCLLPILQRLVKALTRRQLEYLLFLSLGVCGTAPLVSVFFPDFSLNGDFTVALIGPYIGQVLLGYYIERYVSMNRRNFWLCLCSFLFTIVFQVAGTYLLWLRNPENYLSLDNRVLITITASAACFYICVKYLFQKYPPLPLLERAILRMGALTFGIYLLADMVTTLPIPLFSRLAGHLHPMAYMVLWELLIFIISACATALLRLVPPIRRYL